MVGSWLINTSNVVYRCLYSYRQRVRVITQWSKCCGLTRRSRVSLQQILNLTTVMTRIVVDKRTGNTKPHSICLFVFFLPQYQLSVKTTPVQRLNLVTKIFLRLTQLIIVVLIRRTSWKQN